MISVYVSAGQQLEKTCLGKFEDKINNVRSFEDKFVRTLN